MVTESVVPVRVLQVPGEVGLLVLKAADDALGVCGQLDDLAAERRDLTLGPFVQALERASVALELPVLAVE